MIEVKHNERDFLNLERAYNKMRADQKLRKGMLAVKESNIPVNLSPSASRKLYLLYLVDTHLNKTGLRHFRALMILRINGCSHKTIHKYMMKTFTNITVKDIVNAEKEAMEIMKRSITRDSDTSMPIFGDAVSNDPRIETVAAKLDAQEEIVYAD